MRVCNNTKRARPAPPRKSPLYGLGQMWPVHLVDRFGLLHIYQGDQHERGTPKSRQNPHAPKSPQTTSDLARKKTRTDKRRYTCMATHVVRSNRRARWESMLDDFSGRSWCIARQRQTCSVQKTMGRDAFQGDRCACVPGVGVQVPSPPPWKTGAWSGTLHWAWYENRRVGFELLVVTGLPNPWTTALAMHNCC